MGYTEIVSSMKDILVSSAAIIGACVAVKGLSTWKRQNKGQFEHDLSRRILVDLFKYRDSINGVRNPAIWTYEMPSPPEDKLAFMSPEQVHFYGISNAYKNRWDNVLTQRTSLYADLVEAEAIWGDELETLFKKLFSLEEELFLRIKYYLEMIDPDEDASRKDALRDIIRKMRDIMYDVSSATDDEYKIEFNNGIKDIEKYLKPKLIH